MSALDTRPPRMLEIERGPLTRRISLRGALAVILALTAALLVSILALSLGDFVIAPGDVIATLFGMGTPKQTLVVVEWRLPRALLALMLGAALGAAGAIFQSMTRNPLGSPDIIGFDAGAYTGALIVITSGTFGYLTIALGAFGGGLVAALAVYLLAFRRGFQGFRLIIVGIAVGSMLASVTSWLILNSDLRVSMMAASWGMGTLNGAGWDRIFPAVACLVPLGVLCAVMADRMHLLEMGDDTAAALGVRTGRVRALLLVAGVGFSAVVITLAGPIAFIALAAPQIARRVARSAGVTLSGAAAFGALLLATSDLIAQRLFAPTQLPVGLVTVVLGGGYLVWLLIHEARRRR
ncbi:iron-enterobactin ABC transporter permease [Mycetocola lacteus]|uniref:Iron-enterobactin ABC transporter permease n=1 Tax=Mycetocola lacteus TaxID=76637 RepID=A0A3L7AQK9_9MICO|nr:iron chelate uptake ABC transporter family permease subunit [Mycetocola lacteus]RLP82736.1 iron-enterobactin ABC transporter permease [Mycetocola lacteus]